MSLFSFLFVRNSIVCSVMLKFILNNAHIFGDLVLMTGSIPHFMECSSRQGPTPQIRDLVVTTGLLYLVTVVLPVVCTN